MTSNRFWHSRWSWLVATIAFAIVGTDLCQAENWPGFRGLGAKGVAQSDQPPLRWDATDLGDASIQWRTEVPGLGHSSPVIYGDRVFVTTAIPQDGQASLKLGRSGGVKAAEGDGEQTWSVLCFDKASGDLKWQRDLKSGNPRATRHAKATHANTSVAVDDSKVVAFFGSEGLYCLDHDGELLWQKDLGVVDISKYDIGWGYASSPAIHDGKIVLVCDAPNDPYVAAFQLDDGEEIWKKSRVGDCERSWGTPLIHTANKTSQIIVNGWPWIVSYDLYTGDEVWRIEGGGDNPTPSPFANENRIVLTNSHGGKSPIIVVNDDAKGNLTDDPNLSRKHLAWRIERGGSYMSTPVVLDDLIYFGNTNGVFRCFDASNGDKVYEERLGSNASIYSSLVAINDKIYCPSEDGTVYVIQAGREFEVVAENSMGEPCFASPAVSDGMLLVRTAKSLVAIKGSSDSSKSNAEGTAAEIRSDGKSENSTSRKNVLFIAVDDLRPALGCYGDEAAISPNIDRIAEQGMRFDRAYCQVAVCNPSRASLMTGLRPDTLGVWTLPIHFREAKPDAVTIPQWFRKFGYTAVSHGKIFHNPTPDPQSWSEPIRDLPSLPDPYPDGTRELVRSEMAKLPSNDWRKNNLRRPSVASPDLPDDQILDGARTTMAIEDLKRLAKSPEPFFLAMGYIRPHLAWVAPKKYWDMHDPALLPVQTQQTVIADTPIYAPDSNYELSHYVDLIDMPTPWDDRELPDTKQRELVHGYYACVSYVDAQIGRLLDAVEEAGVADNTIIVLWSDHGWKLGENRGWGKMTNYELDARVPFIIVDPERTMETVSDETAERTFAGKHTEQLVELLDVFPTLCDLSGIATPEYVQGESLRPLIEDANAKIHRQAISQYYRVFNGREYMGYTMRTDRYRFIEWRDFQSGEVMDAELYDHADLKFSGGVSVERENIIDFASPNLVGELADQLASVCPPRKLQMLPAVHSDPSSGRWPTDLTFKNRLPVSIKAIPITPAGRRGRSRTIKPNETVTFKARIGGVYVVESTDGSLHEIHSPSFPAETVVID